MNSCIRATAESKGHRWRYDVLHWETGWTASRPSVYPCRSFRPPK